jgi:hypothetical protein
MVIDGPCVALALPDQDELSCKKEDGRAACILSGFASVALNPDFPNKLHKLMLLTYNKAS